MRSGRRRAPSGPSLFALAALALASAPAGAASQDDAPAPLALHVLSSAGARGRFGEAHCHDGRTVEPHPAAAFTGALAAHATEETLVLDTGGLVSLHGVARFAARAMPERLAELVADLGYDALALGEDDLAAPRPRMLEVARRLRARGIPIVATNLRCEPGAGALCEVLVDADDPIVITRATPEPTAVLGMLPPEALGRIAPDRAAGLRLAPLAEALPAAVRSARAAGARLVLAVLSMSGDAALALAAALPEDGRPDVVFLAGEGHALLFARPASIAPALVGPPPGRGAEVRVRRTDGDDLDVLARPLPPSDAPAPAVAAFARAVGDAYCAAWGRPLPGGHLTRALGPEDVADLAARIVREHAGADAAFFNVDAVDSSFRPADPARLSASDLYVALEYDEPIVVADVPARWLAAALTSARAHGVLTPGLTRDGDDPAVSALRIRGRPPVPGVRYRVATLRFLAAGGDAALPPLPAGLAWHPLETAAPGGTMQVTTLRDVVLAALDRADPRDPRDARASPDEAPEWVVRGTIDGTFSGAAVSNPAGYDAALLSTETALQMGLAVDLAIDARAPAFSWETLVSGLYRTQWARASGPGMGGTFTEASDQLSLRSLLSYRGWRASAREIWIPDAYVEGFVESEMTRPEARAWHWLLVRPTAGVRFPLTPELDVRLQVGLQAQVLAPGSEAELGAGARALLRPWTILRDDDGRALRAEGSVDFFAIDLFDRNDWQLRGRLDLHLDLAGPLALAFAGTLYLQEEQGREVGVATSVTIGLRLGSVTRIVGP